MSKVYFSKEISPEQVLKLYNLLGAEQIGCGVREYELINVQ